MDTGEFYSSNPVEVWEQILGEKMHYHFASGGTTNDSFDQAIIDLFPYIKPLSSVLDVGCGWGGPGRLLQQRLGCFITGVTNSSAQVEYINDFEVICADMDEFVPKRRYDTALFVESLIHSKNPFKAFLNISDSVGSVVIKDFVSPFTQDFPQWHVTVRTKDYMVGNLARAGFRVVEYREVLDFVHPTIDYWKANIDKLAPAQIHGQVRELNDLCGIFGNELSMPNLKMCIIHAVREG